MKCYGFNYKIRTENGFNRKSDFEKYALKSDLNGIQIAAKYHGLRI